MSPLLAHSGPAVRGHECPLLTQSGHDRTAQLFRKMTLKAHRTFNDIRRINMLGDEQEYAHGSRNARAL
jgi:hypothetical protein